MAKPIKISQDERYPFFSVSDQWGELVGEVPAETVARWVAAMSAFEKVQDEMEAVFEKAKVRNARLAAIAKAEKVAADAQAKLDALRNEDACQS